MDNPDLPVTFHEIFRGLSRSITLHSKIRIHVLCRSKKILRLTMMDSISNSGHSLSAQGMTCNPSHHLRRAIFLIWNEMISLEIRFESLNWSVSVGWSCRSAAKTRRTFHRNPTRSVYQRLFKKQKYIELAYSVFCLGLDDSIWGVGDCAEDMLEVEVGMVTVKRRRRCQVKSLRSEFAEVCTASLGANHSSIKLNIRVRACSCCNH